MFCHGEENRRGAESTSGNPTGSRLVVTSLSHAAAGPGIDGGQADALNFSY